MKRVIGIMFLVMVVSVFAGCSQGESATKDSVTIAYSNAEPSSLLSWEANDIITQSIISNVYDTLIRRESEDDSLVPGLATEWSFNDDFTEITFTLRPGVKFHNGDIVTADDVVFSINSAIASSFTARITSSFDRMEKIDDAHVKLILKYPYGPIEGCLSNVNCGIVSKKAYEADPNGFSRNPVGSGPYTFTAWSPGESLSFEAFSDYYRGQAAIKTMIIRTVADSAAALVALEIGQIDMIVQPATSDFEYITNNPKLQLSEVPASNVVYVGFNNTDGRFAEHKALREAASYAVNPEAVLIGAFDGHGVLISSPIPRTVKYYPEEFKGFTYDPARSRQILEENGLLNIKIQVPTMDSREQVRVAEVVVEQLRQGGFDAEVLQMDRNAFLTDVYTNSKFEICTNSITAFYPDADFITYLRYHSSYLGGGNNMVMVNNPELDKILDTGRFSNDDAVRAKAYADMSQLMKDEAVMIPLMSYMNALAATADLKGVLATSTQRIYVYDMSW